MRGLNEALLPLNASCPQWSPKGKRVFPTVLNICGPIFHLGFYYDLCEKSAVMLKLLTASVRIRAEDDSSDVATLCPLKKAQPIKKYSTYKGYVPKL